MSVINKTGPHRERLGGKAQVNHVEPSAGWAFGYDSLNRATAWHCETGRANFGFSITSEWHEPPTPPEGFELKDRETYRAQAGDRVHWGGSWCDSPINNCSSAIGMTAKQMDEAWPEGAPRTIASPIPKPAKPSPGEGWRLLEEAEFVEAGDEHCDTKLSDRWREFSVFIGKNVGEKMRKYEHNGLYFRRRLPKPFRISDHGCGVYATRDGREEPVTNGNHRDKWGNDDLGPAEWHDDGRTVGTNGNDNGDLVRYLRPLPKQETPEPQWREVGRDEVIEEEDQFAFRGDTTNVHRDNYFISARSFAGKTLNQEDADHPCSSQRIARRRIKPLPQWTCTGESRLVKCGRMDAGALYVSVGEGATAQYRRTVQRWTNGTDSEWRPVPVTND